MTVQLEETASAIGARRGRGPRSGLRIALCAAAVVAGFATAARAEVRVGLQDGEVVNGSRIGRKSDADRLALRVQAPGIVLTRFIGWDAVRSIHIDGRSVDVARLRRTVGEAGRAGTGNADPKAGGLPAESRHEPRRTSLLRPTAASIPGPDRVPPPRLLPPPWPCRKPSHGGTSAAPAGLPVEARVIGLRDAPLSAYRDGVEAVFPHGIPVSERPFALHLMRARTARDLLVPQAYLRPPAGMHPGPPGRATKPR